MKLTCRMIVMVMVLSLLIAGLAPLPHHALVSDGTLDARVTKTGAHVLEVVQKPEVGSIGGEWAVLGLARAEHPVPQEYWDRYYAEVKNYVVERKGNLHEKKYTEYSRLIVALTSIGADPREVGGYNLLTPLGDYEKTIWQGLNGPIWALIALDSGAYEMPKNPSAKTQATRQMYIDRILALQLEDGGWSLFGGTRIATEGDKKADPDITGMALQALAKYMDQDNVRKAVERALECLSAIQTAEGGYASWGSDNLESAVQVLVALGEMGIPLEDPRFVKNGKTLLDNIMTYYQKDGSFLHVYDGGGSNQMATEQGYYGLIAAQRARKGRSSLYRMNDVRVRVSGVEVPDAVRLHPDVKRLRVVQPNVLFEDVRSHANQKAIETLASVAVLQGVGGGRFSPERTMTRAEFATVVVRALGLKEKETTAFSDVRSHYWFNGYVGSAHFYGLVEGTGNGRFTPNGLITKEQAAVLLMRAAKLCGIAREMTKSETRDILAQFGDYTTTSGWAREALAFCYDEEIFDASELKIEPKRSVLRSEVAQMLYNLLKRAKLLP